MPIALLRVLVWSWVALAAIPVHAAPDGWDLVFEDDFSDPELPKWNRSDTNKPTNNSLQDYLPEQVSVAGEKLVITSENRPSRELPYRSGLVSSKQAWRHGRFEVRAKLPASRGMWPAIWLLPDVKSWPWPSQGEIDIMENRGDHPHTTSSAFHYGTNPPYSHEFVYAEQQTARFGALADYHAGMHTYAVEWDESRLRFFVDDAHHYTVYDDMVGGFLSQQTAPMNLVINTAVGGDFLQDPDEGTVWPQRFLIDSVRVYRRTEDPSPRTLRNGGFDEAGGSLAGWSPFGVDGLNLSVDNATVLDGVASLKLHGQFTGGENYSGVTQGFSVRPGDRVTATANSYVRSVDGLVSTDNSVLMKIEFYDEEHERYAGEHFLGEETLTIASARTPHDAWREHAITATAPVGAVEARVAFVFVQPSDQGGAVHIDGLKVDVGTRGQ